MKRVRVSKSFIEEAERISAVEEEYGLQHVRFQLITATMRDVYVVTSDVGLRILMIYRHGARTRDEIDAEWQFVDFLDRSGISVAPAVRRRNGEYTVSFHAPEGVRCGVLTIYAEGEHLRRRPSAQAVRWYGSAIARIHVLSDSMPISLHRPANDVSTIVRESIAAFGAVVTDRPDDLAYLQTCGSILCRKAEELPQEPPSYGMIHGDAIRANALVSDEGQVTIIDFDLCGPGWRAYDVASYLYTVRHTPEEAEFESAFLDGYSTVRPLSSSDERKLPVFEAVRAIFSIGIPAMNVSHWGSAHLRAFLDGSLAGLRASMDRIST